MVTPLVHSNVNSIYGEILLAGTMLLLSMVTPPIVHSVMMVLKGMF